MKMRVFEKNKGFLAQAIAFAMASFWVTACTSSNEDGGFAGGTTEDAGIIADLNVAGLAQKGPFVKGSVVTLQGVDCKTMEFTDEVFEGSVINNDGEYVVDSVVNYKSPLFRNGGLLSDSQHPNDEALKCNNMVNWQSSECQTFDDVGEE